MLRVEAIIAHEYFHNWTGNRITCRDWFQLCLKEGLTVFRDQEFTADMRSRAGEAHYRCARSACRLSSWKMPGRWRIRCARSSLSRDQQLLHHHHLRKGRGSLCACSARCLSHATFRKGMDLYFDRHDGEACDRRDNSSSVSPMRRPRHQRNSCCGTRRPAPPEMVTDDAL